MEADEVIAISDDVQPYDDGMTDEEVTFMFQAESEFILYYLLFNPDELKAKIDEIRFKTFFLLVDSEKNKNKEKFSV